MSEFSMIFYEALIRFVKRTLIACFNMACVYSALYLFSCISNCHEFIQQPAGSAGSGEKVTLVVRCAA